MNHRARIKRIEKLLPDSKGNTRETELKTKNKGNLHVVQLTDKNVYEWINGKDITGHGHIPEDAEITFDLSVISDKALINFQKFIEEKEN